MSFLRGSLKGLVAFFSIGCFFLSFAFLRWFQFLIPQPDHAFVACMQFYNRLIARVLGIRVSVIDRSGGVIQDNALLVCNHLSYLDIMPLYSLFQSRFITSVEIKNTFFLGDICKAGKCFFIERRSKENIDSEIQGLANVLRKGESVFLFPEGTSSNGEGVLRFKRPFFSTAILAEKPILPITINYTEIDGKPVTVNNRDDVCWYDDMTFMPHFWRVLKHREYRLEITVSEPIYAKSTDLRDELVERAHAAVSSQYLGFTSS